MPAKKPAPADAPRPPDGAAALNGHASESGIAGSRSRQVESGDYIADRLAAQMLADNAALLPDDPDTTADDDINAQADELQRALAAGDAPPRAAGLPDGEADPNHPGDADADADTEHDDVPLPDELEGRGDGTEPQPRRRLTAPEKDAVFTKEFYPHIQALFNFGFRLTMDEDDANDLVQDTYLKAFRFIDSYHAGTNAKAWLFKILKNSFINNFRRKSKMPEKVDYETVEPYYNNQDDQADYTVTPDLRTEMFGALMGDEVSKALNALPVDFRVIILLCDLEGFTYEEIAKIIDIPIGTVRSRLHRARNMLKEKLAAYARSMGYKDTE